MKNKIEDTVRNIRGFTIIEIAVVMIVAGSMLAFLGSALLDFQQKKRVSVTEHRLERIKANMGVYLTKRKKLPCPAPLNAGPETARFGREAGPFNDCRGTGATFNGTHRRIGADGTANAVRFGSIPIRDLDLPDEMLVDGWGNRFTYAVTINQATRMPPAAQYTPNGGNIEVVGVDGVTSVLSIPRSAHYVVLSHGEDQQGARRILGIGAGVNCDPAPTNLQRENCITTPAIDNDSVYMDTMHRDDGTYDDFIIYEQQLARNDDIPTGAVVPFNLQSCPIGWSAFEKGHGRFMMGMMDNTFAPANQNVNRFLYEPFQLGHITLTSGALRSLAPSGNFAGEVFIQGPANATVTSTEPDFMPSDVGSEISARDFELGTFITPTGPRSFDYSRINLDYGRATITRYVSPTQVRINIPAGEKFNVQYLIANPRPPLSFTVWRLEDPTQYNSGDVDVVSANDRARENIPPYVALLYCVKN